MEESEDVRFAEVNCLEEGSEELCKGQTYETGTRLFPGIRIKDHFLFRNRIRQFLALEPDKTFYWIRLEKKRT
jgi:hypothetical protein